MNTSVDPLTAAVKKCCIQLKARLPRLVLEPVYNTVAQLIARVCEATTPEELLKHTERALFFAMA